MITLARWILRNELSSILADTNRWACDPANVNTDLMYSSWKSQAALLADLLNHFEDAQAGLADFERLRTLFAPTAGLCEIVTQTGASGYLELASRMDEWLSTHRPVQT